MIEDGNWTGINYSLWGMNIITYGRKPSPMSCEDSNYSPTTPLSPPGNNNSSYYWSKNPERNHTNDRYYAIIVIMQ